MITLQQSDFASVGMVAKHCNLQKLQIAINEAILFDLKPLLCGFYHDVNTHWDATTGDWAHIMLQHEYSGCNDQKMMHQGLHQVLVRYAYARYVMLNNFDDTPNGGVTKTNEWSIPKPFQDIKNISDRYRTMAFELFKEVEAYICLHRYLYQNAQVDCEPCGCNGRCGRRTKARGYGIRMINVGRKR